MSQEGTTEPGDTEALMNEYAGEDVPDGIGEPDESVDVAHDTASVDQVGEPEASSVQDPPPRTPDDQPEHPEQTQAPDPAPVPAPEPPAGNVGGSRMLKHMGVGETFVWGRSPEEARRLLAAARAIGVRPEVVKFAGNGFIVPDAVYDKAHGDPSPLAGTGGEF